MLGRKIIPLSLALIATLHAADAQLDEISVESTVVTEVADNAQTSADLAQALSASVPSIDMNRRSGIANDIYIRGQKRDNISVDVDGTKIQGACVNRMDPPVSHILASQIDTVEVIEGPYDVENMGTMSGGLKITTKQPTKELHGEINLGMGSWGYKKVGATVSGGNDIVRLLVSASYENSEQYEDGNGDTIADQVDKYYDKAGPFAPNKDPRYQDKYSDMDAYTKKSLMTKMFIKTLEDQELRLSYTANRSDDVLYGNSKMDAIYDDSNIYSVEYNIDNISDVYKNINLQYYKSDVDHPMGTDYRKSSKGAFPVMRNELTTEMEGLKLKNTFDFSGYKVLFGLDGSQRKWDGKYYKDSQPLPGGLKSIDDAVTDNRAVFTKIDKKFGNFGISVGARYDDTEIDSGSFRSNDYKSFGANVMSTYNFNNENKVFLGAGVAYRVPDARELYFTGSMGNETGTHDLEQSKNTEIDLGYELTNSSFNFKIKTFYSKLDDYIYYNADNTILKMGKLVSNHAFENIDAYVYGGEITASYFASDDISLDLGASFKRGKKDDALVGNSNGTIVKQSDKDLADMAPPRASIAANYEYYTNSLATLELQMSDKWDKFDEDNGEQELAGWAVVNMKVKHALDKHAEITVGVNNMLDHTYAVNNTYQDLILLDGANDAIMLMNEPGRYFYTNLTFKF
jgi:iron complex outermembrane receptor protein